MARVGDMERRGIVLAGGGSTRMGQAKQGLLLQGRTLLQQAVDALLAGGCSRVAVVAPPDRATEWVADDERVLVTLEDPPLGGPVAGIGAGLDALAPAGDDEVLVVACDLPRVAEVVPVLVQAHLDEHADALVPLDSVGWPQWLAARYRAAALIGAVAAQPARDASVKRTMAPLAARTLALPDELLVDVDTPEQARAAGIEVGGHGGGSAGTRGRTTPDDGAPAPVRPGTTTDRPRRSVEEYRDELLALVEPLAGTDGGVEDVPLARAHGRVLARPVASRCDVPAFDNSAMDGFAVRHADLAAGVVLREVAEVAAGSSADPAIGPGECVRIMTGAPLPADADTVVPVEQATVAGGGIRIDSFGEPGRHVRRAAEDLRAGDEVLAAGAVLDAAGLSAAAAAGAGTVACTRRPRVAVVATGDELVAPGGELGRGQIFESNGTYLAALVTQLGAEPVVAAPATDDPDALRALLDDLAGRCDLVVLSGGVSVGDHDVVRMALDAVDVELRHVTMQPGKPQGFARWPVPSAVAGAGGATVPVVALPGNPLSTATSAQLFVGPLVRRMLGVTDEPRWVPAVALAGWRSPAGRRQLVPVAVEVAADGRLGVRPAHRRGSASHMVTSLAHADALAMVADDVEAVDEGTTVLVRRMS